MLLLLLLSTGEPNLTCFAGRLRWAMDRAHKTNMSALARETGMTPQNIQYLCNPENNAYGSERVTKLAIALRVNPAWLANGDGDPCQQTQVRNFLSNQADSKIKTQDVISKCRQDTKLDSFVYLRRSKIAFGRDSAGTMSMEFIEESDAVAYPLSWFEKNRIDPKNIRCLKVQDQSMDPLLCENDLVLVDHSENIIKDGHVYAFRYGVKLRIRKIFSQLDGTLILHSINSSYKDEVVSPKLANEHISIIGRVRYKSGNGGL